jgi:hypothetical protein
MPRLDLSAHGPASRALAILVLALLAALLWAGLAQPVIDLARGEHPILLTRRLLAEERKIAERRPLLEAEKAALAQAAPDYGDFLAGATPALAAAELQGRVGAEVKSLQGGVTSVEPLGFPDEAGFHRAGLGLKLSLPQEALPSLLHAMEDQRPRLFIAALSARGEGELAVSLEVFGYLNEAAESAPAAPAPILPPLASYRDLLQRPLFSPSRRPTAIAAAHLASASLRLTGLVAESGRTIALIRPQDQTGEVRVGPGASLNGWQVAAIDAHGLELVAGRNHLHVRLKQLIPPSPE